MALTSEDYEFLEPVRENIAGMAITIAKTNLRIVLANASFSLNFLRQAIKFVNMWKAPTVHYSDEQTPERPLRPSDIPRLFFPLVPYVLLWAVLRLVSNYMGWGWAPEIVLASLMGAVLLFSFLIRRR